MDDGEINGDTEGKENNPAHQTAVSCASAFFFVLCCFYCSGKLVEIGGIFQFTKHRKNFIVGAYQLWGAVYSVSVDFP